jgi:hypothetical protein
LFLQEKVDMPNLNTLENLEQIKTQILHTLQSIQGAPSVQMQDVPPDFPTEKEEDEVRQTFLRRY